MKTTTFILILLPLSAVAQVTLPIRSNNLKDVYSIVNTLSAGKYSVTNADTTVAAWKTMNFHLVAMADSTKELSVAFFKGKNQTAYYEFNRVTGTFDDLLPFWKNYIQPEADTNQILSKQQSVVVFEHDGKQRRLVFHKSGKDWIITLRS